MPGAERYYSPYVKPGEDVAAPGDADGGPMSAWGDLLERMTRELSTDTMEIANLDNQVLSRSTVACSLTCLARLPRIALTRGVSGGVWWQVSIDDANNKMLLAKYQAILNLETRVGPPGPEGPPVIEIP
jgi:hypothetical protein